MPKLIETELGLQKLLQQQKWSTVGLSQCTFQIQCRPAVQLKTLLIIIQSHYNTRIQIQKQKCSAIL